MKFSGQRQDRKKYRKIIFWILGIIFTSILVVMMSIPVKILIARYQQPEPQAIFVITGDSGRVRYAAKFWKKHPEMTVWISDPKSNFDYHKKVLESNGLSENNFKFDWRPTDTVTNFTTLADDFASANLRHFYLITSEDHMPRSLAIATIVFGSRGIIVTPVPVPKVISPQDRPWYDENHESNQSILRDSVRSMIWVFTGWTGADLNPRFSNYPK
jgi:uncharacterized SAM-binding protein YcdF (DUF218 family)